MYSIILGTTFSPTVQLHIANAETTQKPFKIKFQNTTRELRCKLLRHPGVSTVLLEYSTTQHTKTVSTLRYEVLELLNFYCLLKPLFYLFLFVFPSQFFVNSTGCEGVCLVPLFVKYTGVQGLA